MCAVAELQFYSKGDALLISGNKNKSTLFYRYYYLTENF